MKVSAERVKMRVRYPLRGLLTVLLSTVGYLVVLAAVAAFVNFALS